MMKLIGSLIVINSLFASIYWLAEYGTHKVFASTITLIAVFAGLAFILQDRITELTIKGVGTIKAATEQAVADAKSIADIKEKIENQGATVDIVARQALSAQKLSEEVSQKNKEAEENLNALHETILAANKTMDGLNEFSKYAEVVMAAQNDDRKAFDQLETWSSDKKYKYFDQAEKAWVSILNMHNAPFMQTGLTFPWNSGIDPTKIQASELGSMYRKIPTHLKPAFIEFVWAKNDFKKIDKLNFTVTVMKEESSLTALEYAGRYFTQGTNQKVKPLAVRHLLDWWEKHKSEYQDQ